MERADVLSFRFCLASTSNARISVIKLGVMKYFASLTGVRHSQTIHHPLPTVFYRNQTPVSDIQSSEFRGKIDTIKINHEVNRERC